MIETYRGTDFEFIPIYLPPPTTECVDNRVTGEERCSENFDEQVGSPEGSCDAGPVPNIILMSLDQCDQSEYGSCSPAYSVLQSYELTNLNLQQIFKYRINDPNSDGRIAACRWFAENLDVIKQSFIPRSYPRQRRDEVFYQPLIIVSMTLAVVSMLCIFFCAYAAKKLQKTKVMVSLYDYI